ncbi:unnamed protein product [Chilo suppressalis]|uniref:Uncharacterized protein n=1 Tax=Chilo suppressalis TaxID=168631 RepID=A0ABN8B7J1_CHISP|nr:unnamed protein product [Chilo suppressalis]
MYCLFLVLTIIVASWKTASGTLELRPAGWLDRLVLHHRQKLLRDMRDQAPVEIKASLHPRPEDYVDSPLWDFHSVLHLMTLVRYSPSAGPVRAALRRALGPATRRFMSKAQSYKHFPSLAKESLNYFYYNVFSEEMKVDSGEGLPDRLEDDAVLVISNPVEARLPSAQISVKLLRDILEKRAQAARIMPSTRRPSIKWTTTTPTTAPNGLTNENTEKVETTKSVETAEETTTSGVTTTTTTVSPDDSKVDNNNPDKTDNNPQKKDNDPDNNGNDPKTK